MLRKVTCPATLSLLALVLPFQGLLITIVIGAAGTTGTTGTGMTGTGTGTGMTGTRTGTAGPGTAGTTTTGHAGATAV